MKRNLLQRAAPWLVAPALLVALGLAYALLVAPDNKDIALARLRYVAGALFVLPVLWVVISALWPARADRTCPACGAGTLRRLNRRSTRGVVCQRCDHRDATASSWFLAEEEGPLEPLVLEQREKKRSAAVPVDSTGRSD